MADWDPAATWNREERDVNDKLTTDEAPTDELPVDEWQQDDWPSESSDAVVPEPDQPIERFKKRRVVIGVVFLVLGFAGAISDLFDVNAGTALGVSGLIGSMVLLGALVLGARRNARLFSHTAI